MGLFGFGRGSVDPVPSFIKMSKGRLVPVPSGEDWICLPCEIDGREVDAVVLLLRDGPEGSCIVGSWHGVCGNHAEVFCE